MIDGNGGTGSEGKRGVVMILRKRKVRGEVIV